MFDLKSDSDYEYCAIFSTPERGTTRESQEKFLLTLLSSRRLVLSRMQTMRILRNSTKEFNRLCLFGDFDKNCGLRSDVVEGLLTEVRKSGLQTILKLLDDSDIENLVRMTSRVGLLKNLFRACILN